MPMPKLDKIINLLKSGEQFSLTDKEYKDKTGLNIPKSSYYLINKSAVSKRAKEYGYRIILHERKISFEKLED